MSEPTVCVKIPGHPRYCNEPDFMAGGVVHQSLTDSAGGVVGGGTQLCDLGNTPDESLLHFYGEVLALAFFVPAKGDRVAMLPSPLTVLGARRYMNNIEGEAIPSGLCGKISARDWLNKDIMDQTVSVTLGALEVPVAASSFTAVPSAGGPPEDTCSRRQRANHLCDDQRRNLDRSIAVWYQAYEPSMYDEAVQPALRRVIRRIGAGPWGAGARGGDSQQLFLSLWLATSLLSEGGPSLDYYVYGGFCGNLGDQCLVLGQLGCRECVGRRRLLHVVEPASCGAASLWDMVDAFKGQPAQALYARLRQVGPPPDAVFDLLSG